MTKTLSALIVAAGLAASASAQFVDDYDPANWTLEQSIGANGFVASHTASELILVGSNNGSDAFGFTDLIIIVAQDGFISFDWAYDSDDEPGFDAGFYFAGNFVFLSDTAGESGSVLSIPVSAGDLFAFSVETVDNFFGPGELTITNFSFVPAPGTAALLGFGGVLAARRRR